MEHKIEVTKELADLIVNAAKENRDLTEQEHQYFNTLFEYAIENS